MPSSSSPPPLPPSLSSRLQSTIDPLTGSCRHHPQVKLCELVQNNTRWVVRRKICYKCGTGKNGRFHRPGVAIKAVDKNNNTSTGGKELGRSRSVSRSRSGSVQRSGNSLGGRSDTALLRSTSNKDRARSMSRERSNRSSSRLSGRDNVRDSAVATAATATSAANTVDKQPKEIKAPTPPPPAAPKTTPPAPETEEEFDESDPIIFIPTLSPDEELPPPPPMTDEEAGRHAERLEMRRVHDREKEQVASANVVNGNNNNGGRSDVKATAGKKVRGESKHVVNTKKERGGERGIMPSASAMALLNQSHDKKKSVVTNLNNNKEGEEEEASETSSISSASAKMYQLEPDDDPPPPPPAAPSSSSPRSNINNNEPPREIIPSRSRSISRTRTKKSVDPEEECNQLVVHDNNTTTKKEQRSKKMISSDKKQPRAKSVEHRTSRRKTVSVIENPKVVTSKSVVVTSIPHTQVKELSASVTRMSKSSKRQSMSKSVATTGHRNNLHRQRSSSSRGRLEQPHNQSSRSIARSRRTTATTTGRSRRSNSRSRKILDEANDVCSVLLEQNNNNNAATTTGRSRRQQRSRSRSRSRKILNEADDVCSILEQQSHNNKVKATAGTACTQPLSVSSDSMKDKKEPSQLPLVIKKKRSVKSASGGASSSLSKSMPVASIALDSSDHHSHASSMSNSSDVEVETFVYSEDGKKEECGNSKPKGLKSATVMIVKDVKGGAVELARQGRSTFAGLKGTSKKWQSALFM